MTAPAESYSDSSLDESPAGAGFGGGAAPTSESVRRRPSKSYVIPVSSAFRDAVTALADSRNVSPADLARAVLLTVAPDMVAAAPDPGEPVREDREVVVVRSGVSNGRTLRRKPRLQVRLDDGLSVVTIRKALGLALEREQGGWTTGPSTADPSPSEPQGRSREALLQEELNGALAEIDRLHDTIRSLSFMPLPDGVRTRAEALYVLGFPPTLRPEQGALKERFRLLAKVHHPDSPIGDTRRMAQLNDAMKILRGGGFPF